MLNFDTTDVSKQLTSATAPMGTKHSVPVASTQSEGRAMPYSSFVSGVPRNLDARRQSDGSAGPTHHHHGKISTVAIRPHAVEENMSPLDIK